MYWVWTLLWPLQLLLLMLLLLLPRLPSTSEFSLPLCRSSRSLALKFLRSVPEGPPPYTARPWPWFTVDGFRKGNMGFWNPPLLPPLRDTGCPPPDWRCLVFQ